MKLFPLQLLLLLSAYCTSSRVWAQDPNNYYTIEVLDSVTGRGVPLVKVSTGGVDYWTDSNGIVAFEEPGMMNQSLSFEFKSYGHGNTSQTLTTQYGDQSQVSIVRTNLAERLYRATGPGIYEDSVLVGRNFPIAKPLSNGKVLGQDSVQAAVYNNQIHWFWGDSLYENECSFCGNYWTSGATSQLPGQGGLNPSAGIDYIYYEDGLGRRQFPMIYPFLITLPLVLGLEVWRNWSRVRNLGIIYFKPMKNGLRNTKNSRFAPTPDSQTTRGFMGFLNVVVGCLPLADCPQ